jgi:hypothetical protein
MHIKPREEHNVGCDVGSCGFCFSTRVSTLVENMESGANALHGFGALLFWDVRLGKDHGEMSLMSLDLGVLPCLEEDLVIVFLMLHGGLGLVLMQELKTWGLRTQPLEWACRFGG